MQNKRTYYQLILDKSGSMGSCLNETISGFNQQMQTIKALEEKYPEQELVVSLTTFNGEVSRDFEMSSAKFIPVLNKRNYRPSGSTALMDAIGMSVTRLQNRIADELASGTASVVVVIMTDGYENSSKKFSAKKISHLIKELEQTDLWVFNFMGATKDAVEVATSLNIQTANSIAFDKSEFGEEMNRVSESMDSYIGAKTMGKIRKRFLIK